MAVLLNSQNKVQKQMASPFAWGTILPFIIILLLFKLEKKDYKRAFSSTVPANQMDTVEHGHGFRGSCLNPGFSSSLQTLMCALHSSTNTPNFKSMAQVREASTHINVHYTLIREFSHLRGTMSFMYLWVYLA